MNKSAPAPTNLDITASQILAREYGIEPIEPLKRQPGGRVNATWLVRTAFGDYALQLLHPVFGADGVVVMNSAAVSRVMAAAGLAAPRVIPTRFGREWAETGGIWRLSSWLPGQAGRERSVLAGVEAARLLGLFHCAMHGDPPDLRSLPPAEHTRNTPPTATEWGSIGTLFRDHHGFESAAPWLNRGRELAEKINLVSRRISNTAGNSWPSGLVPTTNAVLHGDPKLENFLFDDSLRALALIDLDTVHPGPIIWDLADGLRSWSTTRDQNDRTDLDLDIWSAAVTAYRTHGLTLTTEEWRSVPTAAAATTLNLALRYIVDFFRKNYFAWDRSRYPSLAAQNLSRGAGMIDLAASILDLEPSLARV